MTIQANDNNLQAVFQAQFNKVINDLATVRTALNALVTKYNAALAKLDSDAGVTDTNYNATDAGTACAALTSEKVSTQEAAAV